MNQSKKGVITMPLFQVKSQSQTCTLPDAAGDYAAAQRLAQ